MPELSTLGHVIKAAYEGQPNTNAFTDADKAKLAGLSAVAASGSFADLTNKPPVMAVGNTVTEARDAIDAMPRTMRGAANGVAPLDASAKVPLEYLNVSGLSYLGAWDASTNSPALTDGLGSDGDFFKCSVAGAQDFGDGEYTFGVGDWVIYAGGHWHRIGVHETVTSVNGKIGDVVITRESLGAMPDDYQPTWDDVQNKPNMPVVRGSIGPAIPALHGRLAADLPVPSTTVSDVEFGVATYDSFSMVSGGSIVPPPWASHIRISCNVRLDHLGVGKHFWAAIRQGSANLASSYVHGEGSTSWPAINLITGIVPISGSAIRVLVWHNHGSELSVKAGQDTFINIELFESI